MPRRDVITVQSPGTGTTEGAGLDAAVRMTLMRPENANGGRRPAVLIHRGPAISEPEIDLLEALASALADGGVVAALLEPRVATLILDDFDAYSLDTEMGDVLAALASLGSQPDVDPARVCALGWCWGAIAVLEAVRQGTAIARVVLLNPAPASLAAGRNGRAAPQEAALADALPKSFRESLIRLSEHGAAARPSLPSLIVQAAADRVIPPSVMLEADTDSTNGSPTTTERLLVARADHVFSEPACRAACFERLGAFLSSPAAGRFDRKSAGASA